MGGSGGDPPLDEVPVTLRPLIEMLGGQRVLGYRLESQLDAHQLLLDGLPAAALLALLGNLTEIEDKASVEAALGVSMRRLRRRKHGPPTVLSADQSARAWKVASILAKASSLLGSRRAAQRWLESQAIGLNRYRPIDLIATPVGMEIVETYLRQLEYGVYA